MKFLVSKLPPEPLSRGLPPRDLRSLCPLSSTEFVEPPPPNKIPGYATGSLLDCTTSHHRRLILIFTAMQFFGITERTMSADMYL